MRNRTDFTDKTLVVLILILILILISRYWARCPCFECRNIWCMVLLKNTPTCDVGDKDRDKSCTQIPNIKKRILQFEHGSYLMTSPSRTRRLLRVTRFTRIRSSPQVSSVRTIHTVWRRFFPRSTTVSPLKSCSSSVLS